MSRIDFLGDYLNTSDASTVELVKNVQRFTESHFRDEKYDASHDFEHVRRVVRLALSIQRTEEQCFGVQYDTVLVVLGAYLHDVDDVKYRVAGECGKLQGDEASTSWRVLRKFGASEELSGTVSRLIAAVSYSEERRWPEHVEAVIGRIPETAVVQDADRLDALGVIGLARAFTYAATWGPSDLEAAVRHSEEKLLKLDRLMKTRTGKLEAESRRERMEGFIRHWKDELCCDVDQKDREVIQSMSEPRGAVQLNRDLLADEKESRDTTAVRHTEKVG